MKQVVFAVFLLAMASLTGCLNGDDDSSVDDTTDDTTSDTTEDNTDTTQNDTDTTDDSTSDTTQDDTDTTDDTKDDELIDPVGGNGDITIPEYSSIFIDQSPSINEQGGKWECSDANYGGSVESECDFIYHGDDYFSSGSPSYYDADLIRNAFDFNGWVNKTGETVTIEGLYFPERDSYIYQNFGWQWDYENNIEIEVLTISNYNLGRWVTDSCNYYTCDIVFYGHGGLTFTGSFKLSDYQSYSDWLDTDDDGEIDLVKNKYFYERFTVTFDLPFEPYGFSLINSNNEQIDRIF